MDQKLTLRYDSVGDILYIDQVEPYAEQESEYLGDELVTRLNPDTGRVENVEILFFSSRAREEDSIELPISAELQLSR